MKKQSIFALSLMLIIAFKNEAQTFKTSASLEDDPKQAISHVTGDKLSSDSYDISVFLAATQEVINEIGTYDFEEIFYINGERANSELLWISYEKSSDAGSGDEFLVNPSLKFDVSIDKVIGHNASLTKEKGNKLKIEFLHTDDKRILGTFEITFDVPGFNTFDSDFCQLLPTRSSDKKVETTLHTMFKMMYPHDEITETLCKGDWGNFTSYKGEPEGESKKYIIVFKNKGKLWKLAYDVSYIVENGVLLEKPRVKIYNGMDDPKQVNPSCLKALQATFK